MNTMLFIGFVFFFIVSVSTFAISRKRKKELSDLKETLDVMAQRDYLYQEYVKNTSAVKFIGITNTMKRATFDDGIRLMLVKYFGKLFRVLSPVDFFNLLSKIDGSKHNRYLFEALVKASEKDCEDTPATALYAAVVALDKEKEDVIYDFLSHLSANLQKEQLESVRKKLFHRIDIDLQDHFSDYKKSLKVKLAEIDERITKLVV